MESDVTGVTVSVITLSYGSALDLFQQSLPSRRSCHLLSSLLHVFIFVFRLPSPEEMQF